MNHRARDAAEELSGAESATVDAEIPDWGDDDAVIVGTAVSIVYRADGEELEHRFPKGSAVIVGDGGVLITHPDIEITDLGIED